MNLKLEDLLAIRDEAKAPEYMKWAQMPWRLGSWIGVTDAHAVLCLQDLEAELPAIPETSGKPLIKYLESPLEDAVYDLEHLRSFVIRPRPPCKHCNGQRVSVCDECKGKREVECICRECEDVHDAPCGECGGTGKTTCECDYEIKAALFGQTFNLCVLKPFIRYAPGETFQVATVKTGDALVIGGSGWRLAIMPMRSDPQETYTPQEKVAA